MTTSNGKLTINEFIAPSGKTWRVLRVARDYVERCDIEPVTNTLRSCVNTKTAAQASFQTLILSIEGYDEDPRELHDVPEVRKFFTDLTRQAPWWVHLPARDFGAMAVWLFCVTKHLSPTTKEGERITVNLDGADMMRRLTESLEATAILYQELGYTEAKFKEAMVELSETLAEAGKLANTGKPVWSGDLTMDPNTGKTVPKPVASGAPGALLNLAVAPTGRPVVMDLVQFLDKKGIHPHRTDPARAAFAQPGGRGRA